MILDYQVRLLHAVRTAVRSLFDTDVPTLTFQYPPRLELGDLALTTPFDLAKVLRRKPRELAQSLAAAAGDFEGVRRAEVAGAGYVNLFLERGPFARTLCSALRETAPAPRQPEPVVVEHTSINPNKAAHIGHVRNAVIGDTFVRLLRLRGYQVSVQNYIDDTGVQVADVVVGFQHLEHLGLREVAAIRERFDYHCWDLYARVGAFYAADPANRKLQAETLHAIEAGGNDTAHLAEHIAGRIVDCHLATMQRLGIRYELLARESDILRLRFWERAFERLKKAGAVRLAAEGKFAGCWVLSMAGTRDGEQVDEDKILVRSNGTVTYTGKDIAYQLWKLGLLDRDFRYRRHHTSLEGHDLWTTTSDEGEPAPPFGRARRVYNVIDVGQSYPQRVVKAGVAALGDAAAAEGSQHLYYEKVVLSPATARALGYDVSAKESAVKVSGRKGLGVKADDLIDALVTKARAEIESRDPERDPESAECTARAVAVGALRYFLLRFGRNRIITFDMDEALAFVGETGPYIQNSVVRARSILAKLQVQGHDVGRLIETARELDMEGWLESKEGDEVWSLLLLMARTDEVAEQAVRAQEVSLMARHTFSIAQAFHSYYQKPQHSVLHAEDGDQRALRTLLVDAFVRQMEVLTELLGIPLPERM